MELVVWLYAISNGVGSAREIARLVETDAAYRWVIGDLDVSHQTLSNFPGRCSPTPTTLRTTASAPRPPMA